MYKTFEIKFNIDVDVPDESIEEYNKIYEEMKKLEHHLDYLLNLEEYPEIICAYNANVKPVS